MKFPVGLYALLAAALMAGVSGCSSVQKTQTNPPAANPNPPAQGFDVAGSDAAAIALADQVMQAQGGRRAWDASRYLFWNFFGSRTLLWDKWTGMVRVEWLRKPLKVLVHIHQGTGKVWMDGAEQNHPDTLQKYLEMGRKVWINDSYWLVMPFKMKDSGVTLNLLPSTPTADGRAADVVQLTFKGVGVTPDNKYHVWIDRATHLVTQWAFFTNFSDEKPRFTNAWKNYQRYGEIWLSDDRGRDGANLAPVQVLENVEAGTFEKF
jgi:hypothetical protein